MTLEIQVMYRERHTNVAGYCCKCHRNFIYLIYILGKKRNVTLVFNKKKNSHTLISNIFKIKTSDLNDLSIKFTHL